MGLVRDYREEMRKVFATNMLGDIFGQAKVSLACQRGSHWECTMPGCKCPHHDYTRRPDKARDPVAKEEPKEKAMAVGKV